jgi:hypothetical protein
MEKQKANTDNFLKRNMIELGSHPVAVAQYTCTHKQYTEQYNEMEYTEQHIKIKIHKHKNKNT